ncbi:hypothetical protein [Duganella sp.]|uniref:hypothetical protein n=1 Tax=Duganella sp. TaxID=1904440 RepID=UPI0031DC9480
MLRLWPDTVQLGLFPDCCWLTRSGMDLQIPGDVQPVLDARNLLVSLEATLAAHADVLRSGSRVDIVVSDSVAMTAVLPWQEHLRAPAEWQAYAQACFEQQGLEVTGDWTVQTAFRHHRAAGLAFAVRTDWLNQLLSVVQQAGLRLRTLLPLSAAAYWRFRPSMRTHQTMLLIREHQRTTALRFSDRGLQALDIEPVIASSVSCERLIKRVQANHGPISNVHLWDACKSGAADDVSACLPDVDLTVLPRDCWS